MAVVHESNSTSTSLTANLPSGTVNGDLIVVLVTTRASAATFSAPSGSTGWSAFGAAGGTNVNMGGFWRIASSEPSTWLFQSSSSSNPTTRSYRLSGHDATTPLQGSAQTNTGSGTAWVAPDVTGTLGGISFVAFDGSAGGRSWTTVTGYTKSPTTDFGSGTQATNTSTSTQYVVLAASGATGTKSSTASSSVGGIATSFTIAPGTAAVSASRRMLLGVG